MLISYQRASSVFRPHGMTGDHNRFDFVDAMHQIAALNNLFTLKKSQRLFVTHPYVTGVIFTITITIIIGAYVITIVVNISVTIVVVGFR